MSVQLVPLSLGLSYGGTASPVINKASSRVLQEPQQLIVLRPKWGCFSMDSPAPTLGLKS